MTCTPATAGVRANWQAASYPADRPLDPNLPAGFELRQDFES